MFENVIFSHYCKITGMEYAHSNPVSAFNNQIPVSKIVFTYINMYLIFDFLLYNLKKV